MIDFQFFFFSEVYYTSFSEYLKLKKKMRIFTQEFCA